MRSGPLVSDLDLLLLLPDLGLTEVIDRSIEVEGHEINFSAYNQSYFLAVAASEELTFFSLREIKKLTFGRVLYDEDAVAARTLSTLQSIRISNEWFVRIYARLLDLRSKLPTAPVYSIEFFLALETVILLRMHAQAQFYYSKHKYLMEDAKLAGSSAFLQLLALTARPLAGAEDISELAGALRENLSRSDDLVYKCVSTFIRDAQTLISHSRKIDAVFPLRYGALRAILLLNEKHRTDEGCDSILPSPFGSDLNKVLYRVLSIGQPIEEEILAAFDECVSELGFECGANS